MIRLMRARWRACVLVCAKCEKKLGGEGFGEDGDRRLSRLLRKAAGGKGAKAVFGVASVGCLKACPKRAVTVVDAARPGEWLIVSAGTAVAEVLAGLGLPPGGAQPDRDQA